MSASIGFVGETTAQDVWKGHAEVDRAAVELALEMLDELGDPEDEDDDDNGFMTYDYSCLEDWPRHGRPFRNVVLEYLQRAREAGGDIEAGFCAVLSDCVAMNCAGYSVRAGRYAEMFDIE